MKKYYNLPHEEARFEVYNGKNTVQMPILINEGRVPMSVAGLMKRRLDVRNYDKSVKSSWMDDYFDTGDGIIYHPDGRIKIILDSQYLREMTSETPRNGGALVLGEDVYKALDGEEFKKGKLGKVNELLSRKDVKAHPVWRVLARDQALLNDYADYIFAEGKERFHYYPNAMRIFLDPINGDTPEMKMWYVGSLKLGSNALGGNTLGSDFGRLVGEVAEV
jgi:hypothetical protein|tara:strand:+ start:174 stop:833 length:660 start_codon:yes stop_codon:yes gene_type:complete